MIPPGVLETVVGRDLAHAWLDPLHGAAVEHDIKTTPRLQHWLAQILHESGGLRLLHENLNYTPERLQAIWPHRFPTRAIAARIAGDPIATAETVYGGRLGNRPAGTGDGYTYRGRGLIMLTGRANYRTAGQALNLPLEAEPDLAATPLVAARIAGWYWNARNLNPLADAGNLEEITRRVNGALIGLANRRAYLHALETAWEAVTTSERIGSFDKTVLHLNQASRATIQAWIDGAPQPLVLGACVASRTPQPDGTTKLELRTPEATHG